MIFELPNKNNCTVAVIGLGYVGLPVAVEFARHKKSLRNNQKLDRKIIGFDINPRRIKDLKEGLDITNEISTQELKDLNNICFTVDEKILEKADVFIVTVPTPIDNFNKPDLSLIKKACKIVGKAIKNRDSSYSPVLIFESTLFPGASEEILIPIVKNESLETLIDKRNKKSLAYGYSPERINPGDKGHKISEIIKVTSGNTKTVSDWIDDFYGSIIKAGTYKAQSIKVAEAAKVIENTQRDLNIALVNELSIVFNNLDIDTLDVIDAAKTKWNFLPFKPGLVGGHCIGVDPYYLTYKAQQSGYYPEVILAGRRINDGMARWNVERLILYMISKKMDLHSNKALILGFTFKENCRDIRNTKVFDIVNSLDKYNIKTDIVDPFADQEEALDKYGLEILQEIPFRKKYSIIILSVAHEKFCRFDINKWKSICSESYAILDLKGIVPKQLKPLRP